MVDYATFSALEMRSLFPTPPRSSRVDYRQEGTEQRSYDLEYLGSRWDQDFVDGVFLFYPKAGAGLLGVVEAWASPQAEATASMPGQKEPFTGSFIDPGWSANASVALERLSLPVQIGSSEVEVRKLGPEPIRAMAYPDGSKTVLNTTHQAPDLYYLTAVVHPTEGLLTLKIYRPDLVKKNSSKSAWKNFVWPWK